MKKLFCVFFSFVIFSCCSLTTYATVDLSKSSLVDTKVVLGDKVNLNFKSFIDFFLSCFNSVIEYNARKVEAARGAYFYFMLINHLSCSSPILNDSQTTFCDEYLDYYFNQYWTAETNLDEYYSDFDVFMQAGGFDDVPFSLKKLRFQDTNFVASGGLTDNQLKKVAIDSFKSYYNTMMARFLLANNIAGIVDPAPGKNGLEIAPAYVSSDELIEGIEKDNSNLSPKSTDLFLNSYRTQPYLYDTYLHNGGYQNFSYPRYVLFDNGVDERLKDLYFIPFGLDYDGTYYYLPFQFHFYFDSYDGTNADMALKMEVFIHTQLGYQIYASYTDVFEFNSDNMPYQIAFNAGPTPPQLFVYPDEDSYINQKALKYDVLSTMSDKELFYTSDKSDYKRYSNGAFNNFSWRYDKHIVSGEVMYSGDFGFLCSKSKISTVYDIDTSKIGKGQVVTINGDTIYNYTITNPETGDSSKFGDYITNNYTYITNNGGSSGGSVGGDVTVGGTIDVGGSVAVDVNVNVNGAGGSGNVNPGDFTSAENVDLTKYYDNAVEQSTGFQKFLKAFFDFLPPELLALLLFAVSMAIVCRVFGR